MKSHLLYVFVSTARKESAKEKQLKEEEKILESVAEGRGKNISSYDAMLNYYQIYSARQCKMFQTCKTNSGELASISSDVCEGNGQRYHI